MAETREIRPEMCGKIIDESHFDFHVRAKAKVLGAIDKLKKGVDFMDALSKMNFKPRKEWTANTCKDPNTQVLLEILEEYKRREHRPTRAKVLAPLIEYAIGLYASDLFYRERGEWFLFQLMKNAHRFQFASMFVEPDNWYPKTRNITPGGTNYYEVENDPNVRPIEQDYLEWYGIDVTADDIDDIDPDVVKRIIAENKAYMEREGLVFTR